MDVAVSGFARHRQSAIEEALMLHWDFDDLFTTGRLDVDGFTTDTLAIKGSGESSLGGGVSEEDFTDILTAEVFAANGGPCEITVTATCLDYIPCESHKRSKQDYDRLRDLYPSVFAPKVAE
jgi:hypothetical protein